MHIVEVGCDGLVVKDGKVADARQDGILYDGRGGRVARDDERTNHYECGLAARCSE